MKCKLPLPKSILAMPSRRRRRALYPLVYVTSFIVLLNTGISLLLYQHFYRETVILDVAAIKQHFRNELAEQHLSRAELKPALIQVDNVLNQQLIAWQEHNHATVLVAPAVVGNTLDITNNIQNAVDKELKWPVQKNGLARAH
ncbi:TrbI F-type domain-containing protein [Enterobacteriaceae bacterium YMB-R22]|jgi:conjugal transfer pilin signal peptidase TrbI|uniref:TrbI F-type domain-containing protein n=1 Tax=Tenebrionicola larvae TaxID=2815733 RepID=UPI002011B251|nr:TrbI F-type domain-containing protein [Tenebrionicola larvae]MBV4414389.1 TrbI F-type domain-containing protein [Tenebrionicola larvae]